ncbi:uncharacterized protein LOC121682410 [Alosa sapidissima]|uniref:uncharacterized protein LOC121682410 n=1 Tax=Alosa sapidissima TaxID=34773 RepID=UPI001C081034|nr:uncharacterized protein LOC121682410 [Alosa sapidissima]XP_041918479.1 uncharacterized protein LOC121682410 [Alosa sapidissima]
MERDVKRFVDACPTCAQNKPSNQPPAGLLQPLLVPKRPWSHIALDFVTGLPTSHGLSPFQCCLGYQPPVFPAQEEDVGVPSAQAFIRRCRRTWKRTRSTLLRVQARVKVQADRHRSKAPHYVQGQRVWLSTRDLPLKVVSPKLNPRFIGPYPISKVLGGSSEAPLPPPLRRIHPTFHVSRIKPFVCRPICLAPKPPPPVWSICNLLSNV